MIVQIQWAIRFENEYLVATAKKAERDKVWSETWGAHFNVIYQWFVDQILIFYNISVNVKTVDIMSDEFEELYNKNYAFWLWILYAWNTYRKLREDWVIEIHEVKDIDTSDLTIYWHNHVYYKSQKKWDNTWVIYDTLKTLEGVPIKMTIEALREWVKSWIYYRNARTLVLEDQLLDKHLRYFKKWIKVYDIENLSKEEQEAISLASKLRNIK